MTAPADAARVTYADATVADGEALDAMAVQSWNETFGAELHPEDLAAYLVEAHGPAGALRRDLADPAIHFHVARSGEAIVGYARLGALYLPAPMPAPGAAQLRQIYVLRAWQGRGVADRLLAWATDAARDGGATELYLGVYEENARALGFYRRHGFTAVGDAVFRVGRQVDRDIIMRRAL